ncbi:hypothetical protein BASA81_006104 [Batrachochytrium salamandrivorans]|nr:hypothetical protein BASA81_006104 [Batrachochytrium salamandrivorans]
MKRKLEDEGEEGKEEEEEEELELWSFPKIKAGSFALLMQNDDLKKREGFFLSLHDVFRAADEPCSLQDQERFFELCEEKNHDKPAKSSSPSRFRRSFRANTADSASSSTSTLAKKKKRSLMSEFIDSTFRKHSNLSDAPPATTTAQSEPFNERLARLKARFFGAVL